MNKIALNVITLGLMLSLPICLTAQGRVTRDPNTAGTPAVTTAEKPDPRLAKKITYDSGYKRLHSAVDDISRLSGVAIYCGQGANNWQVRDIPVVICVKDMPLGKLLRAVADATHTHFASEQIGKKSKKSYRIYRRYAEEAKIDVYFENLHKYKLDAVKWQWDTMVAYSKTSPIEGVSTDGSNIEIPKSTWLIAKLIASVGPEGKDRLLDGDTIRFTATDPATKDIMEELYRLFWERDQRGQSDKARRLPTSQDIEASALKIKLTDTGASGFARADFQLGPVLSHDEMYTNCGGSLDEAQDLKRRGLDVPAYPTEVRPPSYKDDMDNPAMTALSADYGGRYGQGWASPLLTAEIDVDMPKDLRDPVFADMIRALAKASGLNIVTEDFTSHKDLERQKMERLFAKKTTVTKALTNIKPIRHLSDTDYAWFFNEKDKLIVGWADDGYLKRWRYQQRNLLPEALSNDLMTKLDGPGVELDDTARLTSIPKDSFEEWIMKSKDFTWVNQAQFSDDGVWQLYNALEPADKLLARSSEGLPLGKFDTAWIAGFFKAQKLQEDIASEPIPGQDRQKILDVRSLRARATSDPKVISTMVMHIQKRPAQKRWDPQRGMVNVPSGIELSSYDMVIDCSIDGENHKMTYALPFAFPIYSPQREAEIISAARDGNQ